METKKWFDRQFNLNLDKEEYAAVYTRLQQAPGKLKELVATIPADVLAYKPEGKWSVKEHIGHLSVLEPLWQVRIIDIQQSKPVLTPTDLDNKATTEAGFNNYDITKLVETFTNKRNETLLLLDSITDADMDKTSLHPRLQKPMNIIAHAYFVAEHDDHHFARIQEIDNQTAY